MKKKITAILLICLTFSCKDYKNVKISKEIKTQIPVLLLGTFHFSKTTDAHSVHYKYNDDEANEVSRLLAKFKPTVICVEFEPKHNETVRQNYQTYLKSNGDYNFNGRAEAEVFSYKIGKLSNSRAVKCIDSQLGYNYEKIDALAKKYHEKNYLKLKKDFAEVSRQVSDSRTLKEKLKLINTENYKYYMKNINADIFTYTNSDKGFDGADIASEFYKRNLRIFANLNKVDLSEKDRVLIIFGAGHIPFLEELIKNSPKYNLEKLDNYLIK
jgi:hypothetical protein